MAPSVWTFVFVFSAIGIINAEFYVPHNQMSGDQGLKMNWIEKKIKEKIEGLQEVLRKGEPALGIPVLDPYRRDSEVIKGAGNLWSGAVNCPLYDGHAVIHQSVYDFANLRTPRLRASTDIRDFSVVGLSSYSVDDVRFSLSNMSASIRLSWTGIKTKTEYNLDGVLNIPLAGEAPLYGNGTARYVSSQEQYESTDQSQGDNNPDQQCVRTVGSNNRDPSAKTRYGSHVSNRKQQQKYSDS